MAHDLYKDPVTGQVSMMYTREAPWHNLGKKLENPATSVDAIQAAGLDWHVEKRPMFIATPAGYRKIDNQYVMIRSDRIEHGPYFGIVGENYKPLQDREAFTFFDDIVGEGAAIYHTAGALGEGERIWILAKLPDTIQVVGDDICDKYLLLSNSHDGKSSVQIKFTPVRVVCQNTLTMALRQGPTLRMSHTKNLKQRMEKAQELLGIIHHHYEDIGQVFSAMVKIKMNDERLNQYYRTVFPDPRARENILAVEQIERTRNTAKHYYLDGMGNSQNGVAGTLWAAYNGVTEMVDHATKNGFCENHLRNI